MAREDGTLVEVGIVSWGQSFSRTFIIFYFHSLVIHLSRPSSHQIRIPDSDSDLNLPFPFHCLVCVGKACARPNIPDVYVKVSKLVDWVEGKTGLRFH
jgi:hypothetical protein